MNSKSYLFTLILVLSFRIFSFAGEGMWIPMLLGQLNEKEMQAMGMKITAEEIYSINQSSMKDAIVLFGRGCTGEIISNEGLLLTNHHCGFGQIQKHSSVEHDYLTDGFWAMSKKEELVNPGLTVTLMTEMREVTEGVLQGVKTSMTETERNKLIKENAKKIVSDFEKDSEYKAFIRPFFKGNQYYMIIVEIFKDIRLVGAPPSNIGKFGGDTDNWMWPRHTGDFSLFRIYVGPDGKPAEYSEDNIPYTPKYFFPISLDGVEKDDFTFVFGYPARTNEYLPSYSVALQTEILNPEIIELRETRLDIFSKYSNSDPKVRIQYATKHARASNKWKKMIGESGGVKRMHGIEQKEAFEEEFMKWASSTEDLKNKYGNLLSEYKSVVDEITPLKIAYEYYKEAGLAIELVSFAGKFQKLAETSRDKNMTDELINNEVGRAKKSTIPFFKDYYQPIDEEVMAALLEIYDENVEQQFKPGFFYLVDTKFGGDWHRYTSYVFEKSMFDKQDKLNTFLANYKAGHYKKIEKDPAYQMYLELSSIFKEQIKPQLLALTHQLDSLQRIYMAAQMEMQPDERFYPDANFTLRVTYGNVDGYQPKDAVDYYHYTTLEGIMQKEDPNIYDYVVEDKLKELYNNQDYGQYAAPDGTLRVAFVATNHTTGGNSGSPVLNAEGQLVGVNFDRCWEGTMSDLMYDPKVCRNISLDIRYFLLIVDKFAGAGYLVDEMELVKK